jgi:hypothetical protein
MQSSSGLVMSEVPSALKQGSTHELMNVKLIAFNDVGGAICDDLEACISLIRVKANAWGDAGGLQCHASGLHHQQPQGWPFGGQERAESDHKELQWLEGGEILPARSHRDRRKD